MFILPFWYGLFYEYTAFIAGILFVILFYKITKKKKQIILRKSTNFYIYVILILSYLITSIWAIDHEMAIEGFLKFLPGVFYFILIMQFESEEKQKIMNTIPISGAVMCIVSYVLGQIPVLKAGFFSENGRLVGFFQYSNSFALFLLIGIVIIANKKEKKQKDLIILLILIAGILLTGSRATFIFTLLYGIYQIIKNRKHWKKVAIGSCIIVAGVAIAILILYVTQNMDILTRLFQISFSESTLIGRLLYYLDGLKIIAKNPFGLRLHGLQLHLPTSTNSRLYSKICTQ